MSWAGMRELAARGLWRRLFEEEELELGPKVDFPFTSRKAATRRPMLL